MRSATCSFVFVISFVIGCGAATPPAGSQTQTTQSPIIMAPVTPQSDAASSTALLDGGEIFDGKAFKLKLPKGWIVKPDIVVALHARATDAELFPNIKVAILKPPAGATVAAVVNRTVNEEKPRQKHAQQAVQADPNKRRVSGVRSVSASLIVCRTSRRLSGPLHYAVMRLKIWVEGSSQAIGLSLPTSQPQP
jgi:hypothetical protein